ncbi:triacylglycerol lipase [Streptomyces griseochromogenes]|uniref:Triacylglycerol lipase n=1 Tax=Streptomyces griseochromogenes TaxID=68214 RepID=A0ABS4LVS0_9ACTN|nr:lipase family protein [Streptomyces griseochromogenes]MBP2051486.1 triacylglycerol lipase [Streptomyces griseochromogenes]
MVISHRSRKPLPRRAALLAAAGLFGGLLAVPAVTAAAGTPQACSAADADIYRPPDRATATPGAVVACRRVDSLPMVIGGPPLNAWKVQYGSTDGRGRRVSAVGTVVVPQKPWTGPGERPLVAFVPGTLGIGPQCAFSRQLAGQYQDAYEGPNIAALLNAGYAVAATDGQGYMDGEVHPYVSGAEAGHAVLDMARAASRVPGTGVSPDAEVGIWGYSEGGSGSLWAAQLARSYAPELHVVGAASGGIPADLKEVASNLDGQFFAGFLVDAFVGLSVTHPELPFDDILDDSGRKAVKDAESLCALGTVSRFPLARIEQYTKDGLTLDQIYALRGSDGTTWGDAVRANKLGAGVGTPGSGARYEIGFPVFQYRGLLDEVIPDRTASATRRAYCDAGVATRWTAYVGDHLTGDAQAIGDVVNWLGDRFGGKADTGNC